MLRVLSTVGASFSIVSQRKGRFGAAKCSLRNKGSLFAEASPFSLVSYEMESKKAALSGQPFILEAVQLWELGFRDVFGLQALRACFNLKLHF